MVNEETNSQNSQIIMGGIDNRLFTGEIENFDVIGKKYWAIELSHLSLLGLNYNIDFNITLLPKKAIIDSGSSLILMQDGALNFFLNTLQSMSNLQCKFIQIGIVCNCNNNQ